eukprot:4138914-Amphidinium_carterae.1
MQHLTDFWYGRTAHTRLALEPVVVAGEPRYRGEGQDTVQGKNVPWQFVFGRCLLHMLCVLRLLQTFETNLDTPLARNLAQWTETSLPLKRNTSIGAQRSDSEAWSLWSKRPGLPAESYTVEVVLVDQLLCRDGITQASRTTGRWESLGLMLHEPVCLCARLLTIPSMFDSHADQTLTQSQKLRLRVSGLYTKVTW